VSRPLATREEARSVDRDAVARGVSGLVLMENAGRGATDVLVRQLDARRALVIGGTGQNGGDAWVVARQLVARGLSPRVALVGDRSKVKGDARINLDALLALGVPVADVGANELVLRELAHDATVIVDGIFGTGLARDVAGVEAMAIQCVASLALPVLALDLPSGIDCDTGRVHGVAIRAHTTATFAVDKRGLAQHPGVDHAGDVHVVDIGVPAPHALGARLLDASDLDRLVAPRARDAHKGTAGHVLVIAGGPGKTGAALLAGIGAMRMGAGLVTLAARATARGALDAKVVELMTLEVPEALEAAVATILRDAQGKGAAVVGPGLGTDEISRALALRLALELPIPAVLDADALTAVAVDPAKLRASAAPRVCTPHPAEAARLLGTSTRAVQEDRYAAASALAERTGHVVVLKGARTIVAAPDGSLAVCPFGTPALGVGGTGDVLAGVVAALLPSRSAFDAACAGVVAHARAGEIAAVGDRGLFAHEVADALPRALLAARSAS
jgi:hydroxyethylthiazole kinase-like uncharacterized protein yjeF